MSSISAIVLQQNFFSQTVSLNRSHGADSSQDVIEAEVVNEETRDILSVEKDEMAWKMGSEQNNLSVVISTPILTDTVIRNPQGYIDPALLYTQNDRFMMKEKLKGVFIDDLW